ncbi:sensor histidine kinase [Pedobacter sp. JCM 36344]|uniref:sensor histidine kinase n=1 Tax=Pedobacter sp. JCM 36344 TaxID=3374280 RepID=UPI00397BFC3D
MKLQVKLALYNTLTKVAVITILGVAILFSINRISIRHIQQRLLQKKDKLVSNLSNVEINDLLTKRGTYTDYNMLKEEYIILQQVEPAKVSQSAYFIADSRSIEGHEEDYQILVTTFIYGGNHYQLELGETMSSVSQLDETISIYTFFILVIAVALTLLADLTFTKFLLNPFYKIVDQKINKVNDPQNFNYHPIATSTQDFKILDQSISALMKKMTSLLVTEKEFIGNVSHELLTPISILNSRLENILDKETLSEEGENKLFACLRTLGRLKSIINSLLLISKVENNQFVKKDIISVRETISGVQEDLEYRLLMMRLTFITKIDEDFTFYGNQSLFHTLVMNIINNAIKYNVNDGEIVVEAKRNKSGFTVTITDTGIGMEAETLKNAFNRFENFDSIQKDSHGLGLSIVKSIALFHNINLSISSQKDVGTKLFLSFIT